MNRPTGISHSSHSRVWLVVAAVVLSAIWTSPVAANGRFPESLRLIEDPKNPDRLLIAGTFGLLTTSDRGKNWYHLCEQAFAFEFLEGDPLLELMADGSLLSGIYVSLNRSWDCGCGWQATLGVSEPERVWDITVDGSAPEKVIALVSDSTTLPEKYGLQESLDNGKTWRKISEFPSHILGVYSVDVAPSDPMRVYASALSRPMPDVFRGALLRSKDRGVTWEELEIPGVGAESLAYIATVHPTNPDAIFVRVDEWNFDRNPTAYDPLLYSTDGGTSWKELIRKGGKLFGFALSPDGSTVLAGYGDPIQPSGRTTDPNDLGIYKASTTDFVFEKIFSGMVSCLRWTSRGLYVCNTEFNPHLPPSDFSLGFASNADFTLATTNPLTSLLSLKDVRGPLPCTLAACAETWTKGTPGSPSVCEQFRAICEAPAADAGLTCPPSGDPIDSGVGPDARPGADAAGAGGAGGAVDAGSRGGSGGTIDASGGSGGASPRPNGLGETSCGCRIPGHAPRNPGLWTALGAGLELLRRRRRRMFVQCVDGSAERTPDSRS